MWIYSFLYLHYKGTRTKTCLNALFSLKQQKNTPIILCDEAATFTFVLHQPKVISKRTPRQAFILNLVHK